MMSLNQRPLELTERELLELTTDTTRIFGGYGGSCANQWSDIQPHLPVLFTVARYINWPEFGRPDPKLEPPRGPLCLEIGVRQGPSTMALLLAMAQAGGKLISLDIDPVETLVARRLVVAAGWEKLWEFHLVHSDEFAKTFTQPLDLLWIDGDHRAPQPTTDFDNYAQHVRVGGMVLLHDYWLEPWRNEVGVQECVDAARSTGQWEVCVLPFSYGLVLMRRIG